MKKNSLLLLLFVIALFSCKETPKSKSGNTSDEKQVETRRSVKEEGKEFRLPPLSKRIYDDIYNHADYLDVIFEDLNFSMSQDNNASIRSFLQNINIKRSTVLNTNCKPMGHVSFIKHGESIIEADFYHSSGCYYFIFNYEGDPPMFSNSMSATGIKFFNNLKTNSFKTRK